jgi:hypothetical protein
MSIIDYIPKGKDNKISRQSLMLCTGLPDRSVRRLISAARADGHAIVGDPDGGYYMAETKEDVYLLLGELASRMGKLAQCYNAVKEKGLAS